MHLRSRCILLVIIGLFCSYAVWAGITGSRSGLVTDPSGAVVSGAQVVATETQTHLRTEVATDSKGFFDFPMLAIGSYDVEVHAPGFKTFRKTGVVIDANSNIRVDVNLQLGATTEQVTSAWPARVMQVGAKF